MAKAIKHRNVGERKTFTDQNEWIREAKSIQDEAVAKARQLSSTAGSLVEWLDRVPPWDVTSEGEECVNPQQSH